MHNVIMLSVIYEDWLCAECHFYVVLLCSTSFILSVFNAVFMLECSYAEHRYV
jgi:hypothetical protein